jgi:enoyl-CoA hydratase
MAAGGRPAVISSAVYVRYQRVGPAALLSLDRPERRNAIDGPTAEALQAGFERFCEEDSARVLIVTGDDTAFCAGADLKAIGTLNPDREGGPLGFTRLASPKPTIAAVSGWALAGGFELALWCDLRIVAPSARFGFAERRWGVPLIDGGTQRLPLVIGMGRALELILTGRLVEPDEALAIGLANEIAADPVARAIELAEALAAYPQETMLSDRRAALAGAGLRLDRGLALEAAIGREVVDVGAEGAARFASGAGRGGEGIAGRNSAA